MDFIRAASPGQRAAFADAVGSGAAAVSGLEFVEKLRRRGRADLIVDGYRQLVRAFESMAALVEAAAFDGIDPALPHRAASVGGDRGTTNPGAPGLRMSNEQFWWTITRMLC